MARTKVRDDSLATLREVAAQLRVTPEKVRLMYVRGELAGLRIGRRVLIFRDSVQAILDRGRRRVSVGGNS